MKEENIDKLFNHNLCIDTRTITFFSDIDRDSSLEFIQSLHILDNYKDGMITVKLSSEGGCVISGFAMYDAIKAMKNFVRVIVYGECSSMATVVLQAFDDRILMPNSFLMVHWGSQTISGHPKSNENWIELYKKLDNKCNEIYLDRVNERQKEKKKRQLKIEEIEKMLDFDTVLMPNKVVSLGLADKVLDGSY